jgi:hypothetical protein
MGEIMLDAPRDAQPAMMPDHTTTNREGCSPCLAHRYRKAPVDPE